MEDSARLTLKGLQLLNVRTFRTPGLLRSNTSLIIDESDGSGSGYFISEVVAVRNSRLNFDLSSRWGLGDDHFANAHVVGEEGLSVFSTVLNSTRLFAKGNTSLDNCTATGNYRVQISGMPSHAGLINRAVTPTMMVRNSHLAHCRGTCLTIREADNASVLLQGSTVQTALDVHSVDGLRLDVRDVTVLEMQSTFLEFARKPSQEPGPPQLEASMNNVTLCDVWSAVKISASSWKLSMDKVTIKRATLGGAALQSVGVGGGTAVLRDVEMVDMLGTALVLNGNIATNVSRMSCKNCNMAITARNTTLEMTEVDILGEEKRGVGVTLMSSSLQARDFRAVNLAAGLVLTNSEVQMEDAFLTDNALGIVASNAKGSITGLTYFNDAEDVHFNGGSRLKVENPDFAMHLNYRDFAAVCLAGCLVSTLSVVQLLKLLYTDLGLSRYVFVWLLGCCCWPVAIAASVKVLFTIQAAVREQEAKPGRALQEEYLSPEEKMKFFFVFVLVWSGCGAAYVCFDVLRNRHSLMAFGDLRRKHKLMEKQDALKKRLDDPTVRNKLHDLHNDLVAALDDESEEKSDQIFQEMKVLAAKEAQRLAGWFEDQRRAYQAEDDGARMAKLEVIPSQSGEAVQPALGERHCASQELAVDALSAYASWLRADFKRKLSEMVTALNEINRTDLRKFDEKLVLDSSLHQLQPEPGAEYGKHLGLLVAPIKSKERALAKITEDYEKDEEKKERPSARYVCDFLRATIYASDPFALAIAFHTLKEHFEIVRVKNKFANDKLPDEERTNILVNLWVEGKRGKQIAEVQFLMQEYLTAKSLQHMYYDVVRAKKAQELFSKPIFR
ncbi:unnamed protein product [Symbiodinium natans]|uniref:Uncharacterized protein n=1 Tax=Symbiodinium natans TaxID=878477 RepID=A0A812JQU3_9DINO|nr:unnamed protein product [Symbiodinium natans]